MLCLCALRRPSTNQGRCLKQILLSQASRGTSSSDNLRLTSSLQSNRLLFKPSRLCYFIIAVLGDWSPEMQSGGRWVREAHQTNYSFFHFLRRLRNASLNYLKESLWQVRLDDPEEIILIVHASVSPSMELIIGPVFWNSYYDWSGKVKVITEAILS